MSDDAVSLTAKLGQRASGICLYGIAPPKQATSILELQSIASQQAGRIGALAVDGVVVYDIQDESDRTSVPRPFPFLPTVDPTVYACQQLQALSAPRIVYRSVGRDTPESFVQWLTDLRRPPTPAAIVLVGAPSRKSRPSLTLPQAYALREQHAPDLLLGGVAIAERHARDGNEHQRLLTKTRSGCAFFVTQAVYDVTAAKSLLSDYAIAVSEQRQAALPLILTFSACGSVKTLAFMQWLGISFPRWLENDLRQSQDPLAKSVALCERIFAEVWEYAREKKIPVGINVESVSVRKVEIDASVELLQRLRSCIAASMSR